MKIKFFTTENCGACTMVKNTMSKEILDKHFEVIDLGDYPELGEKYNITGVPVFIQGDKRASGFVTKEILEKNGFTFEEE